MHELTFNCDGSAATVAVASGETLLHVLRERLRIRSVKDGCAPQGQCGCCTVLVDGKPRVACVTPATRVAGRTVITPDGLEPEVRDTLAQALVAAGGSQCGFCTPGIVVRCASLGEPAAAVAHLDRALAAHLCRCTGWQTIAEAMERSGSSSGSRNLAAASLRAEIEGGTVQDVSPRVPLGGGGFADDDAPADALVAVPKPAGATAAAVEAAGMHWVIGETVHEARAAAAKVQGRRSSAAVAPPVAAPAPPPGGVALATGWVEPAYLEPDASWCEPGGEPASPLANGGAFGAKVDSPVAAAARELADRLGRPVRVLFSREDCVRLGAKRPPIAASARYHDGEVVIEGRVVGRPDWMTGHPIAREVGVNAVWDGVAVPGPRTSRSLRAVGALEQTVLVEGALAAAGVDRTSLRCDERAESVALEACARVAGGATAGAEVSVGPEGSIDGVAVRLVAGDPLDETVLRSYAIGAAHMALGWVTSEGLAVDPASGEVQSLTIRSFGVLPARLTPPIDVTILDDPGPPLPRSSDAVLAAVAAATWNALADHHGVRPTQFPTSS